MASHKTKQATYNRAYYLAHAAEISASKKIYYLANKARIATNRKTYEMSHIAEIAANKAAYYQSNKAAIAIKKQAYYDSHKEDRGAYDRRYQQAHPDRMADKAALRRGRRRGAYIEGVSRTFVYERDGGRCHICGKKVPEKGWHLDHIIPLARGGEHSYRNVAVACPRCNLAKGVKGGSQLRLL